MGLSLLYPSATGLVGTVYRASSKSTAKPEDSQADEAWV